MDDIVELIGGIADPVLDTLKDWGEDIFDHVKEHAPQYLRYVAYALKSLHL